MKTYGLLCTLLFMLCLALALARAADEATAPTDNTTIVSHDDLPKSTDPLIDPLTGKPYIAVHNGDIVESVIFLTEFKLAHPTEHAILLLPEITKTEQRIASAVAFSWAGKVYIHSYRIGDVLVPDFPPAQIDAGKKQLLAAYGTLADSYYKRSFEKLKVQYPLSGISFIALTRTDTFPHVLPNELPGDTDHIQTKRVEARLRKLGMPGTKAYYNVTGPYNGMKTIVTDQVGFAYGDFDYSWTPVGTVYLELALKIYMPSLLDSMLFSIDYQKANPSDKVVSFPHLASYQHGGNGAGPMVCTTVYTKNGQLWFHHLATGDLPTSLSIDDLKDTEKVLRVDLELFTRAQKKIIDQETGLRNQPPSGLAKYLNGYQTPDLSVTGVLAELQKRGVEAKIIGNTDHPRLLFVWGKTSYTYTPTSGCYIFQQADQTTASN
jgi:hypothetical protein